MSELVVRKRSEMKESVLIILCVSDAWNTWHCVCVMCALYYCRSNEKTVEKNRTEQNRTEQNRTEQNVTDKKHKNLI